MIETRSICLGYRGRQVLDYIQVEVERTGRPPSYAMFATELGISTISDVSHIVRRLEKRGLPVEWVRHYVNVELNAR